VFENRGEIQMKKFAYSALALVFVMSTAGLALAQVDDIDYVQAYLPDGTPNSPVTTATVEGVVFVVAGTYNGGTVYILGDDDNGINFYQVGSTYTYGDRVQVTGSVSTFGGEINFYEPSVSYISTPGEPVPVVMTVDEVLNGVDLEDGYENVGKFVDVTGTVTSVSGNSNFYLMNDSGSDTIQVYIDSDTGINLGAVAIGDVYRVLSPVVVYNAEIELKPRKQGDLIEGSGPVIDAIELDDWSPLSDEDIVVSATITDDIAVVGATLYYRDDNGDSTGTYTPVVMTNPSGDTWSGTIDQPHGERQVDFYIEATDGTDITANPGDAPANWYEVAIGFTTIYDVQYADPTQLLQGSSYYNKTVNITGIVTVGTGDAGAASKFIMQDGEGAFNGILCYEGSSGIFVLPGDELEVGGYIDEYYGLTEMAPHSSSAVELISWSNDLPAAVRCQTGTLYDDTLDDGDDIDGEAYESVWVDTYAAAVVDTVGAEYYNTFKIADVSGDTLTVDAMVDLFYIAQMGEVVRVEGFMDYAYGAFELVPLEDSAIVVTGATGVEDELPALAPAGGFSRISPNPFNPKTEVRFVLTRPNLAQLNVYNIRGELVRTLVNGRLDSGEHITSWDGNDFAGQRVSSGTYFARLRIGTEVMQVRKLMLVK
jgi:hypothetical protein